MRPNSDIRVGLIGYGMAGHIFHAPLIAATPGLSLAAVVTGNPDRQALAHATHPGARLLATTDALWALASELDLIVVASPNRSHVSLAQSALAHGLPVVVDKPLAATATDARALIDDARHRGLALTVFQNRRWDGDFLTVKRLLAEDQLGDVFRFESRFERWRPTPRGGWRERGAPEEAGGLLYDLGTHVIDQAIQLFGPVRDTYIERDRRRAAIEVDDDVFVALTHENGVRSHLWMSAVAAQSGPRFRVIGRRAAFTKFGLDVQEDMLKAGARPGDAGYGEDNPDRWGLLGSDEDLRRVPTDAGAYQRFYEGMVAGLRDGVPLPVDPNDAVRVLEIIEGANEDLQSNH